MMVAMMMMSTNAFWTSGWTISNFSSHNKLKNAIFVYKMLVIKTFRLTQAIYGPFHFRNDRNCAFHIVLSFHKILLKNCINHNRFRNYIVLYIYLPDYIPFMSMWPRATAYEIIRNIFSLGNVSFWIDQRAHTCT